MVLATSLGDIRVTLFADRAPLTVSNFLGYADSGFYDGTIFHRVIRTFMIQGGGFTADMQQKPTRAPIPNESSNGLRNRRGALAMARTADPHSARAQFFINLTDNPSLDPTGLAAGYAVFGEVTAGMEVVDRIAAVPTGNRQIYQNVPLSPVTIIAIRRDKDTGSAPGTPQAGDTPGPDGAPER